MTRAGRATRWAPGLTGLAPLAPTLVGSAVNIRYNLTEIDPLLTEAQRRIFVDTKGQRDPIVVFRPIESSPSPRARRR